MCKFQISLANLVIDIQSIHDQVYYMCKDYLCMNKEADFQIISCQEDIEKEDPFDQQGKQVTDAYRETLSIYRKISEKVLSYSTFLMHGSVVATDKQAFMFCASSGIGKTTRTNLFLEQVPNSYVVNGDKPLIQVNEKGIQACGTPWSGKENLNTNVIVPLKAILLLERKEQTTLEKISFSEAIPSLYPQIYRPQNTNLIRKTLSLMQKLNGQVDFYRYGANLIDTDMQEIYDTIRK